MWKVTIDNYKPIASAMQHKIAVSVERDSETVPGWADTPAILLWSVQAPDEVFIRVCSAADLRIYPDEASKTLSDKLFRRNWLEMIFRSRELCEAADKLINEDIKLLSLAIENVRNITEEGDVTP